MKTQRAGGSLGQSLKYVDPAAPERSADAGSNLLVQNGLIARPAIGGGTRKNKKGGFYPSIMSGVVSGGVVTGPLAAFAARKLLTRKGGGKRQNIWKAKKEEAKAILEAYGKPSASNVQKYAAALKKGPAKANEFLNTYKEEKMELQMIQNVKYQEKKAKNMERLKKKAAKEANKATKKAAREATKAAKNATKKAKNLEMYNGITKGEWATLVKEAKKKLEEEGKATAANIELLASLMMNKKNTSQFLSNFRTRTTKKVKASAKVPNMMMMQPKATSSRKVKSVQASSATSATSATSAKKAKSMKPSTTTAATTTTSAAAAPAKREQSTASKTYFEELSKARSYLGTIGAPTGPNMSRYASMKRKGENTTAWEENFKTRRPMSMAKTSKKPTATAKKALTAVKENENNMQGYSENFESE